jgi:hypothetical protein
MKTKLLRFSKWFFGILICFFCLITLIIYLFKDRICGIVIAEANKYLTVPVAASSVELTFWGSFPNLSVDFNNVFIQDATPKSTPRDTLLYSERIRLKFNPMDLWNKNYHLKAIEISPGTLNLKINKKGEVNYMIFKASKEKSEEDFNLKLEEINIEKLGLSYENFQTQQFYKTVFNEATFSGDFSSQKYNMTATGELLLKVAKSGVVNLLSNKKIDFNLNLLVNQIDSTITIPKALINVAGLPFKLDGTVSSKQLDFRFQSKDILLSDLMNEFSFNEKKDLNKFKGNGKINFDLKIGHLLNTSNPMVITCIFGVQNGELTEPTKGIKIKKIKLNGKYSNEGGKTKEYLELTDFHFQTAGGPFSGKLKITKFANPVFEGQAKGNLNLSSAQAIFRRPEIEKINGSIGINTIFAFQNNTTNDDIVIIKCNGNIQLNKVLLKLKEDKRTFENVNGNLFLRNSEAGIKGGALKIGNTDIKIDGVFGNIYNYLNGNGNLQTEVYIESKHLNIEDIGTTSKEQKIIDGRVYAIPNDITGSIRLIVGSLRYEKHQFDNLIGKMEIQSRRLHFSQLSFVNAEALISGAMVIEEKLPEIFTITAQVASQNLKFKQMFKEWDNFKQTVISDANISGRAELNLYFHAPFDLRTGVILKSIDARLDLKVYDGHLKNVLGFRDITESLKTKSGKLVLGTKNIETLEKKLSDVSFKTLENSILIHDGKIEIPKMLISSSALNLEISGTHTFENAIDYNFIFNFRDLLNKEKNTEFGEIIDDGTGLRIFMRMHGTLDNPIIEWDQKSRKEASVEKREEAKKDAKSILKSEFGLFKNDTTVKIYVPKDVPQEDLKIQFGPASKSEFKEEDKKIKKDSKLKKKLQNWKEQQLKEEEEEFKIGGG